MTKLVICPAEFDEFITFEGDKHYISENWMSSDIPSLLCCFLVRLLCVRMFYTNMHDCEADCPIKHRFVQGGFLWLMCWFMYRHSLIPPNEKHFYRRVYNGASEFLYLSDILRSVEVYSILLPFPSVRFALVKWLITEIFLF